MSTNISVSNQRRRLRTYYSSISISNFLDPIASSRLQIAFLFPILIIWTTFVQDSYAVNGANQIENKPNNNNSNENDENVLRIDHHIQKFSIHSQPDCSDAGEFYTENIRNLKKVSALIEQRGMKCFCNWHGMWIFTSRSNFKRTIYKENSGRNIVQNPGKICESRKINLSFLQLHSIRHVGNSNDTLPGLSLYIENEFYGKELYLSPSFQSISTSLSLTKPKIFRSYGLTGRRRWTLYSNTNFTGNSTCIIPWPKNQENNEIKAESKVYFVVGSIQSGCNNSLLNRKRKFSDQPELLTLYIKQQQNLSNVTSTKARMQKLKEEKLTFDGQELKLPSNKAFNYFSIIGQSSWTIYSGTEFNGRCQCVFAFGGIDHQQKKRVFDDNDDGYIFINGRRKVTTTNYGRTMPTKNPKEDEESKRIIGSVKKGCLPCKRSYFSTFGDYEDENDDDDEDNDYYNLDIPLSEIIQLASDEIDRLSNITAGDQVSNGSVPNDTEITSDISKKVDSPFCVYLLLLNVLIITGYHNLSRL